MEEKCEYCSGNKVGVLKPLNIVLANKIRKKNKDRDEILSDFNLLWVSYQGSIVAEHHSSDGSTDEISEVYVNYCPMCGRNFSDKLIDNKIARVNQKGESLIPYCKSLNHEEEALNGI